MFRIKYLIVAILVIILFNGLMISLALFPDLSFGRVNHEKLKRYEIGKGSVISAKWYKNDLYVIIWEQQNRELKTFLHKYTAKGELEWSIEHESDDSYLSEIIDIQNNIIYIKNYLPEKNYNEISRYDISGNELESIKIPYLKFEGLNDSRVYTGFKIDAVISKNILFLSQADSVFYKSDFRSFQYFTVQAYNLENQEDLGIVFSHENTFTRLVKSDNRVYMLVRSNFSISPQYDRYIANNKGQFIYLDNITSNVSSYNGFQILSFDSIIYFNTSYFLEDGTSTVQILEGVFGTSYYFVTQFRLGYKRFKKIENHLLMYGSYFNATLERGLPYLIEIREKGSFYDIMFLHQELPLPTHDDLVRGTTRLIAARNSNLAIFFAYVDSEGDDKTFVFLSKRGFSSGVFSYRISPVLQFNAYGLIFAMIVILIQHILQKKPEEPKKLDYPEYG